MSTEPHHILIAEKTLSAAQAICSCLVDQYPQTEFHFSTSLNQTRQKLHSVFPDLIITILHLPDGDSVELLGNDPKAVPWPVLLLIRDEEEKDAINAIKAGAMDYLGVPPTPPRNLAHIVERTLRTWQNIRERRQAEQKAMRFGRILDASLNEIYTFDAETLFFTQVNQGARRNLGYSMEELRHMTPLDLKPDIKKNELLQLIEPLLSGRQESLTFLTRHRRKDGSCYPVEVHLHLPALEPHPEFVAIVLDLSEKKQTVEALRASEQRFSRIFNDAAAGMVTMAEDGRFLQVNPALTTFCGYSQNELFDKDVYDITFEEDIPMTRTYLRQLLQGECGSVQREKRYRHKSGRIIWGHTSITFVQPTTYSPGYFIGLVQDITEQKRTEEKLRQINRELDAFVRTVSHDLRSPLTTILGFVQHLRTRQDTGINGHGRECLDHIQNAGKRMLELLEDLLTLSRLGYIESPSQPVNTQNVVQTVIQSLRSQNMDDFEVQVGQLTPVRIPKTFLLQVFDNLIGNAVRYGNPQAGPIEVGEINSLETIKFFVRDHGPGLIEEEREQVFESFFRGSAAGEHFGTGLGLATVQKIAHLMGGKTWWEETPGGGSTFWIEFPLPNAIETARKQAVETSYQPKEEVSKEPA